MTLPTNFHVNDTQHVEAHNATNTAVNTTSAAVSALSDSVSALVVPSGGAIGGVVFSTGDTVLVPASATSLQWGLNTSSGNALFDGSTVLIYDSFGDVLESASWLDVTAGVVTIVESGTYLLSALCEGSPDTPTAAQVEWVVSLGGLFSVPAEHASPVPASGSIHAAGVCVDIANADVLPLQVIVNLNGLGGHLGANTPLQGYGIQCSLVKLA